MLAHFSRRLNDTHTHTHNIHDNFEYFTGFWRFITKPHIINEFHFLENIFGIKQLLLARLKLNSRLSPCASIKISLQKLKMNPKKNTHNVHIFIFWYAVFLYAQLIPFCWHSSWCVRCVYKHVPCIYHANKIYGKR